MVRVLAIGAVVVLAGSASAWPSRAPPTVTCDSIITPGESTSWKPKRVVLGVVAVPPAHIPQTVETGARRWPYWSKSGMVVRTGSPLVLVSVPSRWRNRVAVGWGNVDATPALRIASCPPPGVLGEWNPYAGGFLLRSPAACVPLEFRVGGRTATVRFGIGKRCG